MSYQDSHPFLVWDTHRAECCREAFGLGCLKTCCHENSIILPGKRLLRRIHKPSMTHACNYVNDNVLNEEDFRKVNKKS